MNKTDINDEKNCNQEPVMLGGHKFWPDWDTAFKNQTVENGCRVMRWVKGYNQFMTRRF